MKTAKMAVSYLLVMILTISSFVSIPVLDFDNHVYAKDATEPEYQAIGNYTYFFANGTPVVVKDANDINPTKYPDKNKYSAIEWSGQTEPLVLTGSGLIMFGGGHSTELDSTSITFNGGKALDVFAGGLHDSKVTTANLEINGGTISSSFGGGASLFTTTGEWNALGCASLGCTKPTKQDECNNFVGTANITVNDGDVDYVNGGGQGYGQTDVANTTINGGDIYLVTGTGANGKTGSANMEVNGGTIDWLQTLNRGIVGDAAIEVNGGTITTLSALSNNLPDNGGTFEGGVSVSIKGGTVDTFTMGKQEYGGSAVTDPSDLPSGFDLELNLNENAITNIDSVLDNFDDYTTTGRPMYNGLITDKNGNGGIFWHAALASETAIKLNNHFNLTGDAQLNSRSIIDTASLGAITEFEYDGDNNAYSKKVSALVGFDYFTNLETLNMPNNNVQNISFIKDLAKLETIDLSGNRVVDLSSFSTGTLTALTDLDLSNNTNYPADDTKPTKLADINGIQALVALEKLNLSGNNIMDLTQIQVLTSIKELDVSNNSCWDYEEGVSTTGPKLEDLSPLVGLSALIKLNASDNAIEDTNGIAVNPALEEVDLSNNRIADVSALQSSNSIKSLNLDNNKLSNISPLGNLVQAGDLQNLSINNNKVKNLSDFSIIATLSALNQDITGEAIQSSSIRFETLFPVNYVNGSVFKLTPSAVYKLAYDATASKVKVSDFPVNGTELAYDYSYVSGNHALSGTVTHVVDISNAELDVTFQPQGGTVSPATKEVIRGGYYGALPTPEKTGYSFEGWYTSTDAVDLITSDSSVTAAADHSLYADWTANEYTVTFDKNTGDSVSKATKAAVYDSAYGTLPVATKAGYTFDGWYTSTGGTDLVTATTDVKTAKDHTLYAHWTANKYKVTFDKNTGDSVSSATKAAVYDSAYGTLPVATKAGYTFDGWYTSTGGTDLVTAATDVKTAKDHTLYAHWTVNKYTVTFNKNGGESVSPGTKQVTYDSQYGTLPTPVREGYTFEGWFTAKTGGTEIKDTDIVKITGATTLYAKWSADDYTITFNSDGGSTPNPATKVVTHDEAYGELPDVTKEGYTFLGWYYIKPGRVEVDATSTVKITEDTTLYARWIANDYTVTFDKNGGDSVSDTNKTVTYDYEHGELPVATRAGYTFMGWYTDATSGNEVKASDIVKTTSDKTLYAKWKANDYKVTLNVNGGSKLTNSTKTVTRDATYGTLPTPKRKGHSFLGWYTAKSGGTKITADTKVTLTGDQVLYAKWKAKTYKLVFKKNAKKVKKLKKKSKKVKYGSKIGKLPKPKKAGYKFKGWYTKKKGGKKITSKSKMKYDKNIKLYAKWKKRKG